MNTHRRWRAGSTGVGDGVYWAGGGGEHVSMKVFVGEVGVRSTT